MGWFGQDLYNTLTGQKKRDDARKARAIAQATADPAVAARISSYVQKYPHLTPGAALAPAQAGLDVNDPALARIAQLAADRKVSKGQGWFSIGEGSPLSHIFVTPTAIARNMDEIANDIKTGIRWTTTALASGPESAQQVVRNTFKSGLSQGEGLSGLGSAIKATGTGLTDFLPKQDPSKSATTLAVALQARRGEITLPNTSPGGAGIGSGYLPRGPAQEEQANRARESYFTEYADHPIFSLPGYQAKVEPHAGTLGRIIVPKIGGFLNAASTVIPGGPAIFKEVSQPGSRAFNLASAIIDSAFVWYTDPFAKTGSAAKELRAGRAIFSAADMGLEDGQLAARAAEGPLPKTAREAAGTPKSATAPFTSANEYLPGMHPDDLGQVKSIRPTLHPPTTQNWLTTSAPGRKFTEWVANNDSTYSIWKTLGGEKGNITPELAARMADAKTTDSALSVLSSELGVGLRTKPITSTFQPVGGYLGEVKNTAYSSRIFNTMPHSAVHLEDSEEAVTQLVRVAKNGRMSDAQIAPWFDELARAPDASSRGKVFSAFEPALAEHIADSQLTGPISGRSINYARLRGVFEHDLESIKAVYNRQIASKTGVESVDIDGNSIRLRSIYEDAEYFDSFYQLPDARAMRRITSQYGRLLNNKYLDIPIGVLDHLSSVWKGLTILRPALTLRVVGEEQVRMGAAGLDSIFQHPISAISWAMGRKGDIDVLGDTFDVADELSKFAKSQAKSATWRDNVAGEFKRVIPFTDPSFVKAWGNDVYRLHTDDVGKRLAAGMGLDDVKRWLASDEASEYRVLNDITDDAVDGYAENLNNTLKGQTYGNQSLLDAIATGQFNGNPVFTQSPQGHTTLSTGFQNHLKSLVDKDISPDHTIGDLGDIISPRNSKQAKDARGTVTDKLFNTLLTKPSNYLSRSSTFRQNYWQNIQEAFIHGSPEAQAKAIESAIEAGVDKGAIKTLRATATRASGDLSIEELDMYAKAHALTSTKRLLYDLTDKNQLLDSMRLVFPFGEAWKEVMTTWGHLIAANPAIIPRAALTVRGARGSGFFYTDPESGQEMMNYPGSQWVTKHIPGGPGMPSPLKAPAASLNMFSNNPLMPGVGPIGQVAVGKLLPNTPDNDWLRKLIIPYGEPGSPLPSWAQKLWTAAFADPEKNVMFGNLVWDTARYLTSTGQYDLSTDAGKQRLEDDAISKSRILLAFRGLAQSVAPAAPSVQDVAQDKDGHTTLASSLVNRYSDLLAEDDAHSTNEATGRFINEFGMANLLYMQSASKGGDVFTKSGYDWVRSNQKIVSRYPDIYSYLAPTDGGFDIRAYEELFKNGQRHILPLNEALSLANHRAAKMILNNAMSQLPEPAKRTDAQRLWVNNVKKNLVDKFPGYNPAYQGDDTPNKIAQLSRAVQDPLLASQPSTAAIRAYLSARAQVESIAASKKIIGWQTSKAMAAQREWLASVASKIAAKTPSFMSVYNELFYQELS